MHHGGVSQLLQPVQILVQAVVPKSGHDNPGRLVGAGQLARAAKLVNVRTVRDFTVTFVERANLHQQDRFVTVFCDRLL